MSRSRPRCLRVLATLGLAALLLAGCEAPGTGPVFELSYPADLAAGPLDGRILLVVSSDSSPEPRFQRLRSVEAPLVFGVDVQGLRPDEPAFVDPSTRGWPLESTSEIPPGDYFAQAVLHRYTTFERDDGHTIRAPMDHWEGQRWNVSEGNLVTDVRPIQVADGPSEPVRLEFARALPPVDPPEDTRLVKHLKFRSEILSDWWGTDMHLGAVVVLPEGYEDHPDARYPVLYWHGHFPRTFKGFRTEPPDDSLSGRALERARQGWRLYRDWTSGTLPNFLIVLMQHPNPFYDDSYAVNSENVGPYGDALTQELIPRVEETFRAIGQPWARTLAGGSTGGWESLAWQVFYPDMFNGTWTFCPDPVDFRYFQLVDIYEDENAFYPNGTFKTTPVRPWQRGTDDQVYMNQEDASHLEAVLGSRGRSGDQMDIFMSVFGPVGENGYPRLLYDKWTGEIDGDVVEYWRQNYDLRHILERDWDELGPELVGKLHIYMGTMDTYFLEEATRLLEDFLESTSDPYYGGSFDWGEGEPHCYTGTPGFPEQSVYHRVLPEMESRLLSTAPPEADTRSWRY